MIEIVRVWRLRRWYNDKIFRDLSWNIFVEISKRDFFYNEPHYQKHSLVRLDGYMTFSENLASRYPGYMLDKEGLCVPKTDPTVNLDELMTLFRSKNIARYESEKERFFGTTARYTT